MMRHMNYCKIFFGYNPKWTKSSSELFSRSINISSNPQITSNLIPPYSPTAAKGGFVTTLMESCSMIYFMRIERIVFGKAA